MPQGLRGVRDPATLELAARGLAAELAQRAHEHSQVRKARVPWAPREPPTLRALGFWRQPEFCESPLHDGFWSGGAMHEQYWEKKRHVVNAAQMCPCPTPLPIYLHIHPAVRPCRTGHTSRPLLWSGTSAPCTPWRVR